MDSENGGGIVQRRPAETTAITAALAVVIAALLTGNLDDEKTALAIATLLVGLVPAIVTFFVARSRSE